ncbi:hypothetical protein BJ741DRAFT_597499 [Chytriomyces cf. hyalinus JEL632]|nr:hypothetical protein BJ741DRAFT_597499 [Chytriomyces cf. hyalinus JEL632]
MGFCETEGTVAARCDAQWCRYDNSVCAEGLQCLPIRRLPECPRTFTGEWRWDHSHDGQSAGGDPTNIVVAVETTAPAAPSVVAVVPPPPAASTSFTAIIAPVTSTPFDPLSSPTSIIQGVHMEDGARKNTGSITGAGSNAVSSVSPWVIGLSVVGVVAVLAVGLVTAHIRRKRSQEKRVAVIHDFVCKNGGGKDTATTVGMNTPPALRILRRGGVMQLPSSATTESNFYYKDDFFDDESLLADENASVYSVNTLDMQSWGARLELAPAPFVVPKTGAPDSPLPPHP